jgi:hypothetical protein
MFGGSSPSPLAAIAQLVGSGMHPDTLEANANTCEQLANATGYQSLRTMAQALRELATDIRKDTESSHG